MLTWQQSGASPLLLPSPGAPPAPAGPTQPLLPPVPACFAHLERGVMPRRAVLDRSDFLLPLPPTGAAEFGALLARAAASAAA